MTRIVLYLAAGALIASAQPKPNLSGVWELDKSKTAGNNVPRRTNLKIAQNAASFVVSVQMLSNGSIEESTTAYAIGGSSTGTLHGGKMNSESAWDGSTLVVKSVAKPSEDHAITDYWSLSQDGQTLTLREVSKIGTSLESNSTRVFAKKPDSSWDPEALNKTAAELFQNIQIFKGVPAKRIPQVMNNFSRWLGVNCAHCHDLNAYEKDDNPPKQTARKMFAMVRKINQENDFGGTNPVTCWTCHRGAAKPQNLPAAAKPIQ